MDSMMDNKVFSVRKVNEHGDLLFDEKFFLNTGRISQSAVPLCQCIGRAKWNHGYGNTYGYGILPMRHQLGIELVISGQFRFDCMGNCWKLGPGDMMILLSDRPAKIEAGEVLSEKFNLLIGGSPSLMFYLSSMFSQCPPVLRTRQAFLMQPLMEELFQLFAEHSDYMSIEEKNAELITRLVYRILCTGSKLDYPEELSRVLMYIDSVGCRSVSRQNIADHCGLSVRSLNRIFEKYLHTSPAQYCIDTRIETARNLLAYSPELPVKVVARQAGFSSTSFFCKTFRKNTGMTPNEFRGQITENGYQLSE